MDVNSLLEEFQLLPKYYKEKTFLEICKYPYSRFEEICSRILCFYFSPLEEHGFRDLFLQSFFELLAIEDLSFYEDQIKVISEDNAEGKRLDILIFSPDFVIGIENKITANVYNPLDIYKNRIEEYNKEQQFKIVLSVHKITNEQELAVIKNNDFKAVTYSDFFVFLKKNLGQYATSGNQRYLTHLLDFIKTIENMVTSEQMDKRTSEFFFDKREDIEELIDTYSKYQNLVLEIQKDKIAEIRERISFETKSKWWAWQGWDLGFDSFSEDYKIGIESSFKETRGTPLGEYKIYITTWNLKDWQPFEKSILDKYSDCYLDKGNGVRNRVFLHVDAIDGFNYERIVERLQYHFENLKEIVRNKSW